MPGDRSFSISSLGARSWIAGAAALVIFAFAVLAAGRGLASGALGDVARVRFGGDAERTRVVLDLDRETRGEVLNGGSDGRVVLNLRGVAPSAGALSGRGGGLARDYAVRSRGGGSEVTIQFGRAVEIERRFLLPPGDGVDHYRYVIDVRAAGAAANVSPQSARAERQARTQRRSGLPLVVIDAGHGGRDPGSLGANVQEKAVTLAAALALRDELERSGRYRVRLVRDGDVYIHPNRRMNLAREWGADLFISLHADSGSDPATRGASVYTLSEQGAGRAVREFTDRDDWSSQFDLPGNDPSVDRILLDMTQRATQDRSAQFATLLLEEIEETDRPLLRRSHRDAGLAVLLAPDVPAILLEMGFMTNADDERALQNDRSRRRMMRAVAQSIHRYFEATDGGTLVASAAEVSRNH